MGQKWKINIFLRSEEGSENHFVHLIMLYLLGTAKYQPSSKLMYLLADIVWSHPKIPLELDILEYLPKRNLGMLIHARSKVFF